MRRWTYDSIAHALQERIAAGIYPLETRLPALRDLSDEFQVTSATVSRAVNLLEEKGLLEAVPRSGIFVRASSQAGGKNTEGGKLIGFIAFDTLVSPYWSEVVSIMERRLSELGCNLVLGNSNRDPDRAIEYIRSFARQGIGGIVFVPFDAPESEAYRRINARVLGELRASGIPYVLYDRIDVDEGPVSASAGIDNIACTRKLLAPLIDSGFTSPVCISVSYSSSVAKREAEFCRSFQLDESAVVRFPTHRITEQDLRPLASAIMATTCDSLFLINSSVLNGYLRAIESGLITGTHAHLPFVAFEDFPVRGAERARARCLQRIAPLARSVAELCVDRVLRSDSAISHAEISLTIPCDVVYQENIDA